MKKFITLFIFLSTFSLHAQTENDPIKITTAVEKVSETEYDIIFNAKLFKGWYLYSQYNPEFASLPLEITIPEGENGYTLVGNAIEEDTFKKYSDVWEKEEIVFKDKAKITQRIQLTNKEITQVKLNFFGQVCETACINVDESFTISLTGSTIKETISIDERSKQLTQKLKLDLKNKALLKGATNTDSESTNGLLSIFFFRFYWWFASLVNSMCFPYDSFNGFIFY